MASEKTTIVQTDTDIFKQITESSHCIELFFKGDEYCYKREELPITIGRDAELNDLAISSSTSSRKHCTLEVQDNQIGINDQSTNGTYIKIGRADTILIKNSFYPLASQGHLSLGEPIDLESSEIIHFRVTSDREKTAKK